MNFTQLQVILSIGVLSVPCTLFADNQLQRTPTPRYHQVAVVSHGWHTGFVIAAQPIQSRIPELRQRFDNTPNIEIGWGDKGFYQAEKITTWLTLKALFWPTSSVIHAVAVPGDVNRYFSNSEISTVCLDHQQHKQLIQFIVDSFYKDANGNVSQLNNGIYGNSQFYQAVGTFYFMNTCNKWSARGLSSADLDINPMFKLTASSVMRYLAGLDQSTVDHCSDQP